MEITDSKIREIKKLLLIAEAYIEDGNPKSALERIRKAQGMLPDKPPKAKPKAPKKPADKPKKPKAPGA